MKTVYSLYAMYDAELQAFIPDSLGVFLSDEQYISAMSLGLLRSKKDVVEELLPSRRFYKIGEFDVATIPNGSVELTDKVLSLYRSRLEKESESTDVKV